MTESHITYQLQYRRCSKPICACTHDNEKRHGPYWYAFYKENGKMKSRYIGKKLSLQQQQGQ